MNNYKQRIEKMLLAINGADVILIGAGAGLSAAAGLTYSGERFQSNFTEYIDKYKMSDMYSAGFYPFKTEVEKWAYWSKHIFINRYEVGATQIYLTIKKLVENKEHFVITTNVDHQFYKAGFSSEKIFATQGDYGKLQCAKACHNKWYDNEKLVKSMLIQQKNCLIPKSLVPICPVCGGRMEVNIRIDANFLEDESWKLAANSYQQFVNGFTKKRILLLEIGVGHNTPSIIKYPFEQITSQNKQVTLVRINRDYAQFSKINEDKTIVFSEDINEILMSLR